MIYFFAALIGLFLVLLITPIVRRLAVSGNIVDQPGGRRINKQPIPRLGGLAIVIGFWFVVFGIGLIRPDLVRFTDQTILGIDRNLLGVFLGSMILAITGMLDDIYGLSPWQKLLAELAAGACLPLFGIHIQWLAHPFGGPDIQLSLWLDSVLIVSWVVAVINVINWLDGLDGLAAGVSGIAGLVLFFLSMAPFVHQPSTALLAIVLFGTCLGFLRYNFHPAKIFMGDSGSMFLGYVIAIMAVVSGGKLATTGLVIGIPIIDAAWVILRRLAGCQSPFIGDRQHLHHRLIDLGLGQRQAVLLYWGLSALFGVIALSSRTIGKTYAGLAIVGLVVIVGVVLARSTKR